MGKKGIASAHVLNTIAAICNSLRCATSTSMGARYRVLARSARIVMRLYQTVGHPRMMSLHCALAAAHCIVIGPVCGFVAVFVCLFVGLLRQ